MRFLLTAVMLTSATAAGALRVEERGGDCFVVRNGRTVAGPIRLDLGTASGDADETSFIETADDARVWNRWNAARHSRLEVAARPDGSVEITMAGRAEWDSADRRRAIEIKVPADVFDGREWQSVRPPTRWHYEESGTFGRESPTVCSRFLAVDGLTFDFNPLGVGDNHAGAMDGGDGWRHVDSVRGVWRISRSDDGWTLSAGGDIRTSWGGYLGAKLILREGSFEDYGRLHSLKEFNFEIPFEPVRLVAFGSTLHGPDYADGNVMYRPAVGYGWTQSAPWKRVEVRDHASGVFYSAVTGGVDSVYRFGNLPDGHYFLTFAAGNFSGAENGFTVSVNGADAFGSISVPSGTVRQITSPVHLAGGSADIGLSGAWRISALGLQPILYDSEDFSFRRGFWIVDGYEPGHLHRNRDVSTPPRFAVRDETIPLPAPGSEFLQPPRETPSPVDLPPQDLPSLRWTAEAGIHRVFNNSSALDELDAPGAIDAYLDREFAGRHIGAIMLSGMLSRHTYAGQLERGLDAVRRITTAAHRRGVKVIDHWDATLVWNIGEGFRDMAERTPELTMSIRGNLPAYQLCIQNPVLRRKLFDYAARDVANGVDALQIDEVLFWKHGCVCRHCRDSFARDTGWTMPMDETDPAWRPGSPFMKRWKVWRIRKATDFLLDLRRSLKSLKPDLVLSAYTTPHRFFSTLDSLGEGRDIFDLARTVNFFGVEVMSLAVMRSVRAELPYHRTARALTFAHGAPVWNWYYNADWQNDYVSWALSRMNGQTPLLAEVDHPPDMPDYPGFRIGGEKAGASPFAEVALLYSAASRDWNRSVSMRGDLLGTAQALEALHIPYEVIPEVSLDASHLSKFKVLFIGSAHCLAASQVAAVREFAESGGLVRLSTLAGACDELGERRKVWPFADVFGFEPRADADSAELVERPYGKGRMVYSAAPRGAAFERQSVTAGTIREAAPDAAAEAAFRREIMHWTEGAQVWSVSAPENVYTSVWRERDGTVAIHFLNATGVREVPGETVRAQAPSPAFPPLSEDVVFSIPAPASAVAVAMSPDFEGVRNLVVGKDGSGRARVVLPRDCLKAYTLVRIAGGGEKGEQANGD